jgi:hypothetical protein
MSDSDAIEPYPISVLDAEDLPPIPDPPLTHAHFRRLRFYWEHGGRGSAHRDVIDITLQARRLIEPAGRSQPVVYYQLTQGGVELLEAERARNAARRAPHDSLASRLAVSLRAEGRITWENVEFVISGHPRAVRPDVYSMVCTRNEDRMCPTVHEVKVSRSDFHADLAVADKRGGYQKLAARLFYVTPPKLLDPKELPDGCGLVEEASPGRFVTVKRAKSHKVNLPPAVFMNLILKPGQFTPL